MFKAMTFLYIIRYIIGFGFNGQNIVFQPDHKEGDGIGPRYLLGVNGSKDAHFF